ncbi:DUF4326 domain-containing protein [Streptomyces sp. NPDC007083]|uniref:DUF4326 domain-containing protein n=1 Tax=Streptomyces sp. NPDC007083 TaxID=3156913 RepID=UPI0033E812F6
MNDSIRVVNKHTSDYDVYIGRGSVWGTPFQLAPGHTDADRAHFIAQYEVHLLASPELLRRLPELCGKRIACFCAPKPCHGDVLKKYVEALYERTEALYSHALLVTGSRTWDNEKRMRQTFNDAWRAWGPSSVTKPVLLSGHCPDGADVMAEGLWRAAGFKVLPLPADWRVHGNAAGFRRNQKMVQAAASLRGLPRRLSEAQLPATGPASAHAELPGSFLARHNPLPCTSPRSRTRRGRRSPPTVAAVLTTGTRAPQRRFLLRGSSVWWIR